MKLFLMITVIFFLCSCEKNKIERGQILSQLKNEVNKSEALYLNEMSLIFQIIIALLHKHSKAKLSPSYLNLSDNLGVRSAQLRKFI
ncbi:hypothetical protein G0029_16860 (plasmid) [Acinetobacter sp. YH12138]|uniref:hypothetical protein n=1 Tax=unclassified Acinetobacter TaxID=196816 RepID=UPI0015D24B32|nr:MULTISPECIES: hypothetical protein [unclassified Acinetobacter]QOW51451.1 hypothetical protein G0029_16860 [Acinetobacter sp. YH12138]